jgi:hypothetical protein
VQMRPQGNQVAFIEVLHESLYGIRVTRIGRWRHYKDLRSGEGWWEWDGPTQEVIHEEEEKTATSIRL